jgi:hypothetical protein
MQGYQRHTAMLGSHYPSALNPCPTTEGGRPLLYVVKGDKPLFSIYQPLLGQGRPAVPVSPGHVRRLHPYPPSRRRRR